MTIVVHDASILIDLVACDLAENWFGLGFTMTTTSLVWREVNRRHQKERLRIFVDRGDLMIEAISAETISDILRLRADLPRGVTVEDASVLHLAAKLRAILLSSDGLVRRCGSELGVEVHGVLWLLDTLVLRNSITGDTAADRLEKLLKDGTSWLPEQECKARLKKWRRR
jgi:predicted nucleic acid-binding protein